MILVKAAELKVTLARKAVPCVNCLEIGATVENVKAHLCANEVSVISCIEMKPPNGQQQWVILVKAAE